jgi:hypothetical protein
MPLEYVVQIYLATILQSCNFLSLLLDTHTYNQTQVKEKEESYPKYALCRTKTKRLHVIHLVDHGVDIVTVILYCSS